MPMDEPVRERVKAAMATRLATIATEPGYLTVPALVTRAPLAIDQHRADLAQGPVLGVTRSSGSTYDQETQTSRLHRVVVAVIGYVRGMAALPADTALERLWEDHLRCLRGDPTLGGLARDCEPLGGTETDEGALEPSALFVQDWLVTVEEPVV
jgi:hypothetical protein